MKKVVWILVVLFFILLICFGGYIFAKNVREDQELTKEKMKEINKAYKEFNSGVMAFAAKREELYSFLENTYLEDIANNYQNWNLYIDSYEKTIKEVEKNSSVLKESCFIKFASVEVNSNCTNFIANYEAAMNYYITDIKNYNKIVKEYNTWAEANSKEKLEKGKLVVHKKYIDFDKDGEYFGKEENNEQ